MRTNQIFGKLLSIIDDKIMSFFLQDFYCIIVDKGGMFIAIKST